MPIETLARLRPLVSGALAEGCARACATSFVHPIAIRGVKLDRMAVAHRAFAVIAPRPSAIRATHDRPSFDTYDEDIGIGG
jgi:hypothetical protein